MITTLITFLKKYKLIIFGIFLSVLNSQAVGQLRDNPVSLKPAYLTLVKDKKTWTVLDRVNLITCIAAVNNKDIIVYRQSPTETQLRIAFFTDSGFAKIYKEVYDMSDGFFNVLYPFALHDSVELFQKLLLYYCIDSTHCTPIEYALKKVALKKLTMEEKLRNILALVPLECLYKIEHVKRKKQIKIIVVSDSSQNWQRYDVLLSYSQYISYAIYDYVLPKQNKQKYFESINFLFVDAKGKERERFQFNIDAKLFKIMYSLVLFVPQPLN